MNQKQLLRFIKRKLRENGDDVVCLNHDRKEMNLNQVFDELDLTAHDLTIDMLDVHAVYYQLNSCISNFDITQPAC